MSKQRNNPFFFAQSTLDFSQAKILVVGDAMLDRNWQGAVRRISPEAPVPVVNVKDFDEKAGGAANVAMNLACLGAKVALCALVGEDDEGTRLSSCLKKSGIVDLLQPCPLPTISKLRVFAKNQQLIRLDFERENYGDYAHLLREAFIKALDFYDAVIFSDYGKGALAEVEDLISVAKAHGKFVLVDPKGRDFSRYRGADVLTPNRAEFEAVFGSYQEEELLTKARQGISEIGVGAILLTLSERGMRYMDLMEDFYLPAQAREVFDVTGAGDTVIATLAAAMAANYPLPQALHFANSAAGVVVKKQGTATLDVLELQAAIEPQRARTHGVVDLPTLLEYVESARARGQKIVMTNGCFDILHVGHISYLEEAKALGDRLIVAVNSDDSVRRLKGEGRPANRLESRARVLAALESVDWVVAFSEDTPLNLIEQISPDVLVKGGDNKVDEIVGADWVLAHGGEVKALSYLDGFSTTRTLAKYAYKGD